MKLDDSTTPGPWAASFAENSGYDCMTGAWSIRSVPAQRFVAVLDLGSYGQKSCEDGFTSIEAESNARLIAAAPDLLAVAKSFVALYDGVRDVLVSDGVKAKLAAAEAAIAKAVAIVAVLLIAATAQAQETIRDQSLHVAPFVVITAGQSADVLMTMKNFQAGCTEANVGAFGSARPTTARLIGIKAAGVLPAVIITAFLQKSGHQKAANVVGLLVGGIGFAAAGWNLNVDCRRGGF